MIGMLLSYRYKIPRNFLLARIHRDMHMLQLLIPGPKRQRDLTVTQDIELTGDDENDVEASCAEIG